MSDALRPRRLRAGEEPAFAHAVTRGFHEDESDEALQPWIEGIRSDASYRAWVVADGDALVGNLGVIATDLSLPGAAPVRIAAITAVGVAQSHRRRGLLRALMGACLDEAEAAGEPAAALYASESPIYTRFGFGLAAPARTYRLQRAHTRFRDPVDPRLVESVAVQDAVAAFAPVFEASRRRRAGVGRLPMQWHKAFEHDPPQERGGVSARRLVQVPGRGYAAYRIRAAFEQDLPAGTVEVQELVATDAEAEAALWQHVCDIDLTTTILAQRRPPDDALPRMLTDPLRTGTTEAMPVYVRVLDVARAFEARSYRTSGRAVLRVHDTARSCGGTWHLEVSPGGVSCTSTDAAPDLELSVEELSALWLGGVRTTRLVDAGRVVEHRPEAAVALDRLLMVDRAPWTPFMF